MPDRALSRIIPELDNTKSVYQLYSILLKVPETREQLQNYLLDKGIFTKVYFYPIHLKSFYKSKFGYREGSLPISEMISSKLLTIPISFITLEQRTLVNDVLVKEIKDIPQFPEHIVVLQKKLNDPEVNIKEISDIMSQDPSLTGEIIRYSNTAYMSTTNRISSLIDAIKIIGLRGIKNIIYSYGTKIIFKKRNKLSINK